MPQSAPSFVTSGRRVRISARMLTTRLSFKHTVSNDQPESHRRNRKWSIQSWKKVKYRLQNLDVAARANRSQPKLNHLRLIRVSRTLTLMPPTTLCFNQRLTSHCERPPTLLRREVVDENPTRARQPAAPVKTIAVLRRSPASLLTSRHVSVITKSYPSPGGSSHVRC